MDAVMKIYTAEVIFPDESHEEQHFLDYDSAYWALCNEFRFYDAKYMSHYEEFQNSIVEKDYYESAYGKIYHIYTSDVYKIS